MAKIKKIKLPNDETTYELEGTVTDISDTTSSIDAITTDYPDIDTNDVTSTLFGKIKKFLSDLKSNKQDSSTAITTSNIGSQSVNYANLANFADASHWIHSFQADWSEYGHQYLFGSKFNVNGDGRFKLFIYNNNSDTTAYETRVDYATSAASAASASYLNTDKTQVSPSGNALVLYATDTVTCRKKGNINTYMPISAKAFNTGSSKLMKENISEMTDEQAKKLLELNVVDFDYIKEFGGLKNQSGLIAEDVLDIFPNVVTIPEDYDEEKTKNAIKNIGNGKIPKVLSLDYSKLVPYLIKMIQIQQKEIDELKDRIVALKELIEY